MKLRTIGFDDREWGLRMEWWWEGRDDQWA